jgi:hypothetical protein
MPGPQAIYVHQKLNSLDYNIILKSPDNKVRLTVDYEFINNNPGLPYAIVKNGGNGSSIMNRFDLDISKNIIDSSFMSFNEI